MYRSKTNHPAVSINAPVILNAEEIEMKLQYRAGNTRNGDNFCDYVSLSCNCI